METRKKTRTKKQREADYAAFMERLRNTPESELSQAARWMRENAGRWGEVKLDMRAVLK